MVTARKSALFAALGALAASAVVAVMATSMGQAWAGNEILGELALKPATSVERDAGVWIDGQYLGYLKELKGKRKVLLLPGEHRIAFRLSGYKDVESTISMEPGEKKTYRVTMLEDPSVVYPDLSDSGQVQIDVEPQRAAVFVDGNYAGHVDEFNGRKGLWVSAGKHEFEIRLPGYQPFITEIVVNKGQRYRLETELTRGAEEVEEAE